MTVVLIGVIGIVIWSAFYIRSGYRQGKELKDKLEADPQATLSSFNEQIKEAQQELLEQKEKRHKLKVIPGSFSEKRQLKRLEKEIRKNEQNIDEMVAERDEFLAILTRYRENHNLNDPKSKAELMEWIKNHH